MDRDDLIVVGAGIVGLAHAWLAARRGLRVRVIERDAACIGASIRNFGFVTVTGQRRGAHWQRAVRSRDLWLELAAQAGIRIEHRGLWLAARESLSVPVLEAFLRTEMGEGCRLLDPDEACALHPALRREGLRAVLHSPHDLRVESRDAIARIAGWLEQTGQVRFQWGEAVLGVDVHEVRTARRSYAADRIVVCTGAELNGLFAGLWDRHALRLCQLQMLRVETEPGLELAGSVMADLSLIRYEGYSALPEAEALRPVLQARAAEALGHGIHLIVVQSADGSLVAGDSHHYGPVLPPFASERVDELILELLHETLAIKGLRVRERWTGIYPSSATEPCLVEAPADSLRAVVISSGTGASTAFGLAEQVLDGWGL